MEVAGLAFGATSLGIQVLQGLRVFVEDFKDAGTDYSRLKETTESFGAILERMKLMVDTHLPDIQLEDQAELSKLLGQATSTLNVINNDLLTYSCLTGPIRKRDIYLRTRWALKNDIPKVTLRLDIVKSNLALFLNSVQLYEHVLSA